MHVLSKLKTYTTIACLKNTDWEFVRWVPERFKVAMIVYPSGVQLPVDNLWGSGDWTGIVEVLYTIVCQFNGSNVNSYV